MGVYSETSIAEESDVRYPIIVYLLPLHRSKSHRILRIIVCDVFDYRCRVSGFWDNFKM